MKKPMEKDDDRLFVGVYPTGISYADRSREEHGDYKRLAFLPFRTLELEWSRGVPADLRRQVEAHARTVQARRGEDFEVSTAGQTVRLGEGGNRAGASSRERRLRTTEHAKSSRAVVYMLLPTFAYPIDYSSETGGTGGVSRVRIASSLDSVHDLDDSGRLVSRGAGVVGYVYRWGDGKWTASPVRVDGRDPATQQEVYRVGGITQSWPTRTRALDHLDWLHGIGALDANRAGPESMEVAETIARQLGGGVGRLSATIGAHSFSGGRDSLQFRFRARARNGSNSVRIVLEPSDTYRVEFWSIRGASAKLKKAFDDVYADSLRGLFENETGLYLSL